MSKRIYTYRFTGEANVTANSRAEADQRATAIRSGLEWTLNNCETSFLKDTHEPTATIPAIAGLVQTPIRPTEAGT